ncbi:MAG: hypothetical protein NTX87_20105 [Planctomycetota bacterium]|nr:hypothetical protein [Planctomycetota bacterium]
MIDFDPNLMVCDMDGWPYDDVHNFRANGEEIHKKNGLRHEGTKAHRNNRREARKLPKWQVGPKGRNVTALGNAQNSGAAMPLRFFRSALKGRDGQKSPLPSRFVTLGSPPL